MADGEQDFNWLTSGASDPPPPTETPCPFTGGDCPADQAGCPHC